MPLFYFHQGQQGFWFWMEIYWPSQNFESINHLKTLTMVSIDAKILSGDSIFDKLSGNSLAWIDSKKGNRFLPRGTMCCPFVFRAQKKVGWGLMWETYATAVVTFCNSSRLLQRQRKLRVTLTLKAAFLYFYSWRWKEKKNEVTVIRSRLRILVQASSTYKKKWPMQGSGERRSGSILFSFFLDCSLVTHGVIGFFRFAAGFEVHCSYSSLQLLKERLGLSCGEVETDLNEGLDFGTFLQVISPGVVCAR